jgi:hypothetical protein
MYCREDTPQGTGFFVWMPHRPGQAAERVEVVTAKTHGRLAMGVIPVAGGV